MRTIICCVRHGKTDGNASRTFQGRSNIPLNAEGLEQAKNTGLLLLDSHIKWDVIISSPLDRALQTCQIIKDTLKISNEIIIDNLAIERSFGEAEGTPITDKNYLLIKQGVFKNQETEAMIIERGQNFIDNLLKKYDGQKILVVSHSHFIKSLLVPHDSNLKFDSGIPNGSVNILIYENQVFDKMFLNCQIDKLQKIID